MTRPGFHPGFDCLVVRGGRPARAGFQVFKRRSDQQGSGGRAAGKDTVSAHNALPGQSQEPENHGTDRRGTKRRHLRQQASYGSHVNAINQRLRALGLRTYSPEEIRNQVAQAEIDAYFRNDPDAAISASKRLAAQYILRGLIATHASRNPLVNVNQVSIRMDFTLTGANGRTVSQADARNESYAGRDTSGMALTLINERADEVVGQLYSDYCLKAGMPVGSAQGRYRFNERRTS